jgi:uncharacterized protein YbjT (DUF2867 family)
MSSVVVVGGTGQAGRALVRAAVAEGHDVRVVSRHGDRGPEAGARHVRADVLAEDEGPLRAAFAGADVVVDTLNHQGRDAARVLPAAAQAVTRAAGDAGVGHVVVLSIAHVDRAPGFAYYRAKVAQEDVYGAAAVPSTVVRATQFHTFLEGLLFGAPTRRGAWSRGGLVPYPRGGRLQPIDLSDVARALLEAAAGPAAPFSAGAAVEERGPGDRVVTVGGPQELAAAAMAQEWRAAHGLRRRPVGVPLPGAAGRFFSSGDAATPEAPYGTVTYAEHLARTARGAVA